MKKIISFSLVLGLAPLLSFAATDITTIINILLSYLTYIIPALITIAVIYFIWGVITFIMSSDEESKKNGRSKIINGLIGLFVIVAFWGIIAIVKNSFNINNELEDNMLPEVPIQ